MEFKILDLDHLSEKDLLIAIEKNHQTAVLMRKEIEKLEKVNQSYKKRPIPRSGERNAPASLSNKYTSEKFDSYRDENFEDEIDYYLFLINSINTKNHLQDNLEQALPSRKKDNYLKIVTRIKMELLKNIKDIYDLIEEENDTLTKEDLEEFKKEIQFNEIKIKTIDKIGNIKVQPKIQEKEENNLIFVPTSEGNIRVLDELEDIDVGYLEGFKELFDSIKDGTFKNIKRFKNNNNLSGVCEVKDYKIRVVFDRISEKDYAIITAFIKKSDNDKGYRVPLELRVKNYLAQKETLKSQLQHEEFRRLNKEYHQILYSKLSPDKPPKKVYV